MFDAVHKGFLHEMMWRKVVSLNEARELLKNCQEKLSLQEEDYNLQAVIDEINNRVCDLKMQIRTVTCEVTGHIFCTLAVTVETNVSRLWSKYTPNELQLFHKILDEIVTSSSACALLNTCINLNTKLPEPMSKSAAETTIRQFLEDKWLIEANKGAIYLSARCISDMQNIIRDIYGEYVGNCPLCQQLAIVGEKCHSCLCRTHRHCLRTYNQKRSVADRKCFKCGSDRKSLSSGVDD